MKLYSAQANSQVQRYMKVEALNNRAEEETRH